MADALGEGAGPLSGDVHKVRISRDLVEHRQDSFWFRQQAPANVRLELQQGVVDLDIALDENRTSKFRRLFAKT